MVAEREVPLAEVLALVSTVGSVEAVEAEDRADVDVTVEVAGVEVFDADAPEIALVLPEDTAGLDDAVSRALPVDGAAPAPAPDDEPPVFDETVEVLPLGADWM